MESEARDYVKALKAHYEHGDLRETWYCVAVSFTVRETVPNA